MREHDVEFTAADGQGSGRGELLFATRNSIRACMADVDATFFECYSLWTEDGGQADVPCDLLLLGS